MTINFRHYSDYPRGPDVGRKVLAQLTAAAPQPDVICVQEGLDGVDVLRNLGYKRASSTGGQARILRDMVYGSQEVLTTADEENLDKLVVNEIYVRGERATWDVIEVGATQISSDQILEKDNNDSMGVECVFWPLAVRALAWVKLRNRGPGNSTALVMCTNLTGGTFEDQFFLKQLSQERVLQVDKALRVLGGHGGCDAVVLAGDLGITLPERAPQEAVRMRLSALMSQPGSQAELDITREGLRHEEVERRYRAYASSALTALKSRGFNVTACGTGDAGHVATIKTEGIMPQAVSVAGWRRPGSEGVGKVLLSIHHADATGALANGGNGANGLGRCESLRREHRALVREHQGEQVASEQLQARLTCEMDELRDSCNEKGQAISLLTSRLSDTATAVKEELRTAAQLRYELETELAAEEARRIELEATLGHDEKDAEAKVAAAEQQLASMTGVRESLEAQIRTSLQIQAELHDHIAAERSGRAELEVAGQRELSAWKEHNSKVHEEIQDRLEAERSEVDTWRAATARDVSRLREESAQFTGEEAVLLSQLATLRESQGRDRARLHSEAAMWHHEVAELRRRVERVDEECRESGDFAQALNEERVAAASEKRELEDELNACAEKRRCSDNDLAQTEHESQELKEELERLRNSVARCRDDPEHARLCEERDEIQAEIQAEAEHKELLEDELAAASRGWCRRRNPESQQRKPLPPPAGPPPGQTQRRERGGSAAPGGPPRRERGGAAATAAPSPGQSQRRERGGLAAAAGPAPGQSGRRREREGVAAPVRAPAAKGGASDADQLRADYSFGDAEGEQSSSDDDGSEAEHRPRGAGVGPPDSVVVDVL